MPMPRRGWIFHAEARFLHRPARLGKRPGADAGAVAVQSPAHLAGIPLIFSTRPISAAFMALAIRSIGRGIWVQIRSRASEVSLDEAD